MNYNLDEHLSFGEFETTALSPGVKGLLCSYGIGVWPGRQNNDGGERQNSNPVLDINHTFVDQNGKLKIEECAYFIQLDEDSDKDSSFYARAAFKLAPTFRACEKFWSDKNLEEFSLQCKQCLQWTGKQKQLFLDCFEILTNKSDSKDVLALLLLCTGIEQCLRNLFVLEKEQCPMLLKEILASNVVEKHMGEAAAQILQILLGPPISMNLRNVVWHGFLCEGEISPRYAYFLLIFIVSLGSQLPSVEVNEYSLIRRHYLSLSKVDSIRNTLLDISDGFLESIRKSVLSSWVAGTRRKKLVQDVFDLHTEKRYGFSSVQGFPILENALRRRFVEVNNCPHRLLTAEATTLYTTYEEILDCFLPDGQKNKLVCDLGEPFMDLLHDLLIYPDGPRARDRLGHGESDVYDAPASLSLTIIICLCYLSAKGRDEEPDIPTQDVVASVNNYESQFHPVTELKEKILNLSLKSTQNHTCLRTDPDLRPWGPDNESDIFTKNNSTYHCIVPLMNKLLCHLDKYTLWDLPAVKSKLATPFEGVHDIIMETMTPRVSTLHRWLNKVKCQDSNVSESEIISLMHRVIVEMLTVLDQMECTLQQRQEALDNRLLRSRQRDNTKRLICLFPSTVLAVNYLSIMFTWLFRLLNQQDKDLSPLFKKIQKFLKTTLQLVENVRTYTSKDNNKWTKAEENLVTLVQNGEQFISGFAL